MKKCLMTTRRALILFSLLSIGFSSIFLLPKVPATRPTGIHLELPSLVGEWYGETAQVSANERLLLGAETEFARKLYRNGSGAEIFVSIVLSGQDMNTSIHRPENCLPTQGFTIVSSKKVSIPIDQSAGRALSTTRLNDLKNVRSSHGDVIKVSNLDYYWFVGFNQTTASHVSRMAIDIRDRVLRGTDQRWAYVTVTANVTEGLTPLGFSEQQTDQMIQAFIKQLVPKIQKPSVQIG